MRRTRAALAALCAVQIVDVMGVTVMVAALPRMLAELGGSPVQAGLVVPVYAVGFASLLLVSARLGDRYGPRRLLLIGLFVFAAGSAAAALAAGVPGLIAARAVQGVAAAIGVPNALVMLTALADTDAARARALGVWNACGGLAGALGLVVGGVVTTTVGWRAIFWANLIIAVMLIAAVVRLLPARSAAAPNTAPLPMVSVLMQVVSIAAVVAAANIAQGSPIASLPVLGLSVLAAGVLVWKERRAAQPLVPTALWTRPGFLVGLLGSFGVTATTSSFVIVATLWLQDIRALSAASAGLLILPFSIAVVIAAAAAGRLVQRLGAQRLLLTGLAMIALSTGLVIAWPSMLSITIAIIANGVGNGASAVAAYALATAVPAEHRGAAAGLLNTAAQIGTAVVVALAIATAAYGRATLDHRTGWATAAIAAVVVIAAITAISRRQQSARTSLPV